MGGCGIGKSHSVHATVELVPTTNVSLFATGTSAGDAYLAGLTLPPLDTG
jgi:hypothetical protein